MKTSFTNLASLVLIAALCGVHPTRGGGEQPKENAGSLWMKQKLVASQNLLAGLTKADYETIEKNAQSMIAVGYLEKWIRADTPEYQTMLRDFLHANKSLMSPLKRRIRWGNAGLLAVDAQLCQLPQGRS